MSQNSEVHAIVVAWGGRKDRQFSDWVRSVADSFNESGLNLEAASRLLDTNPAELEAVRQLALLDEEELAAIGPEAPPRTAWFALAGMDAGKIKRALKALESKKPAQTPSSVVNSFNESSKIAPRLENVAQLPSVVFKTLAGKAKRYALLSDKARKALFDFGRRRDKEMPLSDKQAAWAESLLEELIAGGAIKRNSPDDDADICNQVLDLLGK